MNRRYWLLAAAGLLVVVILISLFLSHFPVSSPPITLAPSPLVTWPPEPPTLDWGDLPTVTPAALGMRAAPTATPGEPSTLTPLPTPTATFTPEPTPTPVPATGHDDVPMVEVPAGEFIMGIDLVTANERYLQWSQYTVGREVPGVPAFFEEIPQLNVSLSVFRIDQVQVTNARYRCCIQAGICSAPDLIKTGLPDDYLNNPIYDHYPAGVTWEGADVYCQWVGKRLPTEAEWEKAARGVDGRTFPWGEEWDESCVAVTLEPVGNHLEGASPYGVLDAIGNLPEWTLSTFTPYPGNSSNAPSGFASTRVARGGTPTVYGQGLDAATTTRLIYDPREMLAGFRCVRGFPVVPLADVVVDYRPVAPTLPTVQSVNLERMVYVPAGEFLMGTLDKWISENPERHRTEAPQHTVYLDAFYIDKYEVTNMDYVAFLNALGQNTLACYGHTCASVRREEDINTSQGDMRLIEYPGRPYSYQVAEGYEHYPVIGVSWYGAQTYCAWLGKRLPTEAEWEKAARGTDGRRYPWGSEWDDRTLAGVELWEFREIGLDPLNISPYGVVDMLGNAGEWVVDWFDSHYYALSPGRNPLGPSEPPASDLPQRSLRSPAGYSSQWGLSARGAAVPSSRSWWGFRCAYSTAPIEIVP